MKATGVNFSEVAKNILKKAQVTADEHNRDKTTSRATAELVSALRNTTCEVNGFFFAAVNLDEATITTTSATTETRKSFSFRRGTSSFSSQYEMRMRLDSSASAQAEMLNAGEGDEEGEVSKQCIDDVGLEILVGALETINATSSHDVISSSMSSSFKPSTQTITEVDVAYNEITAVGAERLAIMLEREDCKVTDLDLQCNSIADEGALALAQALKVNKSLVSLQLASNSLSSRGAEAIAEALRTNCTLTSLALGENRIGDRGVEALASMLKVNRSLKELSLFGNGLAARSAELLANGLKENTSLVDLDLGSNLFGDEGAAVIAAALLPCNDVGESNLTALDLQRCDIEDAGFCSIAQALRQNTSLKNLNLAYNSFREEKSITEITNALATNETLQSIDLRTNAEGYQITEESLNSFLKMLCSNRSLTRVSIDVAEGLSSEQSDVMAQMRSLLSKNEFGFRVALVTCQQPTHTFGLLEISCINMAGNEVLSTRLDPFEKLESLIEMLVEKTGHRGHWQLVFPESGTCPTILEQSNLRLVEVV